MEIRWKFHDFTKKRCYLFDPKNGLKVWKFNAFKPAVFRFLKKEISKVSEITDMCSSKHLLLSKILEFWNFFKPVITEIVEIFVISKISKVYKLSQICYFALECTFSTYINSRNLGNFLFRKSEHISSFSSACLSLPV